MDFTVAEFVVTDPELTSEVEMATTAFALDNPVTVDEYVTWERRHSFNRRHQTLQTLLGYIVC